MKWLPVLLLLLAACANQDIEKQNALVVQFNNHAQELDRTVAAHNALLENIRAAIGKESVYQAALKEYLVFVEQNRQQFLAFEEFVRANEAFLQGKGVNTPDLLAQLRDTVDTMDDNVKNFQAYLNNPVGTPQPSVRTTIRRFQFVPTYR